MAGLKGGFITGANAKIKLGGLTIAYCTDVGYDETIATVPVEAMGRYEVYTNEVVGITVNGSLSVIRYTKRAAENGIQAASANGNGAPAISTAATAAGGDEDQTLQAHATPGRILASETFDIEVYEKVTEPGPTGTAAAAGTDIFSVVKIQDCRLTRRGMTLNKRGLYVDNYAFVGVLVADGNNDGVGFDSLSNSGVGPDLG